MEREVDKAREKKVSRQWRRKKERGRETVKAVGSWRREKGREGRMSPMAATHHSQLNDAVFFLPSPASFLWERGVGSSAGAQSNRVKQSSPPPGGTVLHQGNVCGSVCVHV